MRSCTPQGNYHGEWRRRQFGHWLMVTLYLLDCQLVPLGDLCDCGDWTCTVLEQGELTLHSPMPHNRRWFGIPASYLVKGTAVLITELGCTMSAVTPSFHATALSPLTNGHPLIPVGRSVRKVSSLVHSASYVYNLSGLFIECHGIPTAGIF